MQLILFLYDLTDCYKFTRSYSFSSFNDFPYLYQGLLAATWPHLPFLPVGRAHRKGDDKQVTFSAVWLFVVVDREKWNIVTLLSGDAFYWR